MKKKFLLIGMALVAFVSTLSLYFILRDSSSPEFPSEQLFRSGERPVSLRDSTCREKAVEYYSYKSIDPEDLVNNKFGLYIYAENRRFIRLASELVNSNGGDWGYVLIPYNVKDYDTRKWRSVFSLLLEERLVPVIQLYDVDADKYEEQTKKAAKFLDSFLWPVRTRYISVYNEPNDAKFWKGYTNPDEYAQILNFTIDVFKEQNSNFFLMNGAFNVSAPSGGGYTDSFVFMQQMDSAVPGIFSKLDGWASHPYPQPNFSGSPHTPGRNGIRAYVEELTYLKNNLGVEKDLPVFITETGWAHAEGSRYDSSFLSAETVAEYIKIAYEDYWLPDPRVQAVMPFTIWYPPPFDHFSWIDEDYAPYPQYSTIKAFPKAPGTPEELLVETYFVDDCT